MRLHNFGSGQSRCKQTPRLKRGGPLARADAWCMPTCFSSPLRKSVLVQRLQVTPLPLVAGSCVRLHVCSCCSSTGAPNCRCRAGLLLRPLVLAAQRLSRTASIAPLRVLPSPKTAARAAVLATRRIAASAARRAAESHGAGQQVCSSLEAPERICLAVLVIQYPMSNTRRIPKRREPPDPSQPSGLAGAASAAGSRATRKRLSS